MAKNKKNQNFMPVFLLIILPLAAIGISSFAIFKGVQNYITTSEYFKIKEFKIEGLSDARYLSALKEEILGKNIFRVDVGRLEGRIKRRFPNFYSVSVTRILPSQLWVVAKERKPVAMLKRDSYYIFDAEGVALSATARPDLICVPLIIGLENRVQKIRVGNAYSQGQLHQALVLARSLKAYSRPQDLGLPKDEKSGVTKIDASVTSNLSFYLGEDVEVRIGDRDFENRLDLLPPILRSIGADLCNVRYIDLRPKEPVVAMKNEKK